MLKSVLLAGFFLVTSNFMPASPVGTPTVVAANIDSNAPRFAASNNIVVAKAPTPLAAQIRARLNLDSPETEATPDALAPEEREFIERINGERTERGLNALSLDPLLVLVARSHSREMCDRNYFDHHSPTPGLTTPMDRYLHGLKANRMDTPRYLLVGENIYYCSISSDTYNVAYGHQALMNSPGHRANILEPRFGKIGVGVFRDAQGEFWVTEMFMKDRE